MLKKLTCDETNVLDESTMKETPGTGITSCFNHFIEIASDCQTQGGPDLGWELYEEQRINEGGWV